MGLQSAGRLAGILVLAAGLAGCLDAKVDIAVTSPTTARAVMTQEMGADFYAMIKTNAAEAKSDTAADGEFCATGTLTENADGSATCVIIENGPFAELTLGNEKKTVTFTPAGPGLVRVALPTVEMKGEIGVDDAMDEETRQMIEAIFTGHAITLRFSGREVTDTNMALSPDRTAAEQVIPFLDLINGTVALPDELYAVVRVQ
ncbi:hypothetical protein [uncultured Devosia sp.]|uniref:hypothetical protein n=1 Tax=uncultured Devosia sp. TaxID=211434 RepID=UPI0035CC5115